MRYCWPVLCFALLCPIATSQEKVGDLSPVKLKVGQVGYMKDRYDRAFDQGYPVRVFRILGDKKFLGNVDCEAYERVRFIVDGFPTKDLADDSIVKLPGTWKVARTEKLDGRTHFVLAPAVKTKKN